ITSYVAAIIASMDSTSLVIALLFISKTREHRARGVVSGNTADCAAAERARPAEKHIFVFSLDAPGPDLLPALGKRKRRRVLKDVPVIHSKGILDVHRGFAFDAGTPVTRDGKTIFNRFFEPLIDTRQESSLGFAPHAFIISDEQVPRRIESEQRHGVESLLTQIRREDAVVCERMAIHLAWRFFRQTTFRGMVETNIHLLIAFVAVESP